MPIWHAQAVRPRWPGPEGRREAAAVRPGRYWLPRRQPVKRGQAFGLSQAILVVSDPRHQLVLPHPDGESLCSTHNHTSDSEADERPGHGR
jgi:hypothetical protein